jgi:hypothetical protein
MTREEVLAKVRAIMKLPAIRIVAENGFVNVFKLCYHAPDYLVLRFNDSEAVLEGIKYDIREEVE